MNNSDNAALDAYLAATANFNPVETVNAIMYTSQLADEDDDEGSTSRQPRAPRRFIRRDRLSAADRLYHHYFSDTPVYPEDFFRRRFRMRKQLFIRICQGINSHSEEQLPDHFRYFHQRPDCTGLPGFNIFQKCTSAIRQLAYGCVPDALDEYLQMGQQTHYECLNNFCKCICQLYSDVYLRTPTLQDVQRLHAKHEEIHGFPGMLGSIDCMHWPWRNCPTAWQGQYTRGDQGCPTIMLEAVASYDLWIWHAYFGPPGSNNDINVLNQSDLFDDLLNDRAPVVPYDISGQHFTKGYYLADGIYPEWATLVKSFRCPVEEKTMKFKTYQEAARKDIERAFGVLKGRWAIIKNPAMQYSVQKIRRIMLTCVILHNMITEDNGRAMCELEEDYLSNVDNFPTRSWNERVATQMRVDKEMRDKREHRRLRNALIDHVWNLPQNFLRR